MLENVFKDPASQNKLEGLLRNDEKVQEAIRNAGIKPETADRYAARAAEYGFNSYVKDKKGLIAKIAQYGLKAAKFGLFGLAVMNPLVAMYAVPAAVALSAGQSIIEAPEELRRAGRQGDYTGLALSTAKNVAYVYSPLTGLAGELLPDEMRKRQRMFYSTRDRLVEDIRKAGASYKSGPRQIEDEGTEIVHIGDIDREKVKAYKKTG